ncbi:hypothetical protein PENTCL1PPCAC_19982, partial [Pristionchus entomophagus]
VEAEEEEEDRHGTPRTLMEEAVGEEAEDGVAIDGGIMGTSAHRTTIGRGGHGDKTAMGDEGLTCYRDCLEAACGVEARSTNRPN